MNANVGTELSPPVPLPEQRTVLRQKIRSQRQLIADQLGPAPVENTAYPRSNIMRFLTQRPGLAGKIAIEVATVLVGARFIKSASTAFGFAKFLRPR